MVLTPQGSLALFWLKYCSCDVGPAFFIDNETIIPLY